MTRPRSWFVHGLRRSVSDDGKEDAADRLSGGGSGDGWTQESDVPTESAEVDNARKDLEYTCPSLVRSK